MRTQAGDADDGQRQADHDDEVRIANGKTRHGSTSWLFLALILQQLDRLGLDVLAGFQTAAVADHHQHSPSFSPEMTSASVAVWMPSVTGRISILLAGVDHAHGGSIAVA